jgi:hypothetical protein
MSVEAALMKSQGKDHRDFGRAENRFVCWLIYRTRCYF